MNFNVKWLSLRLFKVTVPTEEVSVDFTAKLFLNDKNYDLEEKVTAYLKVEKNLTT
jgi:hypothetical protein